MNQTLVLHAVSIVISVIALGLSFRTWLQRRRSASERKLDAHKGAILKAIYLMGRPTGIASFTDVSSLAIDELVDDGLIVAVNGDDLFSLTEKGEAYYKVGVWQ